MDASFRLELNFKICFQIAIKKNNKIIRRTKIRIYCGKKILKRKWSERFFPRKLGQEIFFNWRKTTKYSTGEKKEIFPNIPLKTAIYAKIYFFYPVNIPKKQIFFKSKSWGKDFFPQTKIKWKKKNSWIFNRKNKTKYSQTFSKNGDLYQNMIFYPQKAKIFSKIFFFWKSKLSEKFFS